MLVAAICMAFFTSCEKESPTFTKDQIVGLWYMTSQTEEDCYGGNKEVAYTKTYTPSDEYYIRINEDNTLEMDSGDDQIMERLGYYNENYKLEGNKLVFDDGDYFLIESCSTSALVLSWKSEWNANDDYFTITCEFVKQ